MNGHLGKQHSSVTLEGIPRSALHLTLPEQAPMPDDSDELLQGAEKLGKACRLLKKFQMQGRREEETGAYWEAPGGTKHSRGIAVVREDFRRPSTQQMDFFSSL